MIEPEFVQEERLPLIQNYDSVYEDTQETSFNDAQQDEKCQLDHQIRTSTID